MGDTAGPFKEIEDQFLKGCLSGAKENCKWKAGNLVQPYLHSNLLLYYLQGVFKGNNYSLNNYKNIITLNRGRHSISSLPQQAASSKQPSPAMGTLQHNSTHVPRLQWPSRQPQATFQDIVGYILPAGCTMGTSAILSYFWGFWEVMFQGSVWKDLSLLK